MRILLVDDDEHILKILSAKLESRGHSVDRRVSGLGVLATLAGHGQTPKPDLVVLDNYMPDISGRALLELAARTPSAADVPVIFHSADNRMADAVMDSGHKHVCFVLKGRPSTVIEVVEYFDLHKKFVGA